MRNFLMFLGAMICLWSACQFSGKGEPDAAKLRAQQEQDSIKIAAINDYIQQVEQNYIRHQKEMMVHPPDEQEKIVWLENEKGEVVRMIYGLYKENPYFKQTWYVKDGQIIYYRFQQWVRTETPNWASEIVCLLDNGKVFYTMGKYLELEEGERPINMASMPYKKVENVNVDSTLQKIHSFWDFTMNVKKNGEGKASDISPVEIK
ncbi:MAG: hypothetical protein D6714_20695 [Bacteroidetes bacterium]|nr:MAG: hypothetical protein D6714_20695 [Bacteroidota bacterium]